MFLYFIYIFMEENKFTVDDFRAVAESIIETNRLNTSDSDDGYYLETLNRMRQMDDDELLQAKLYSDLGLDSIDVWEIICAIECEYNVYIDDAIDNDVNTGVNLNVEKLLDAINGNLLNLE